jgi:hypothetical protein
MMICPYCKRTAISIWRKCILGPEKVVACLSCGRSVGVPWGAAAAAIPVAFGAVAAVKLSMPWSIAGFFCGLLAYFALQLYVVPIVGRDG